MDMVTMNIIDSSMVSICREMGITLMKTSYSTIFNEGLDFTCAIADTDGEMVSVAEFCPAQIGGMPLLIKTCAEEIPIDQIEEGDVIVHNDPYRGGLHVPEHTLFKPVFADGKLLAFVVAIGHIAEVGGMVPGGFAGEATEIFHEGVRVPPVKIMKRGQRRRCCVEADARERAHAAIQLRRLARHDRCAGPRRGAPQGDGRQVRPRPLDRDMPGLSWTIPSAACARRSRSSPTAATTSRTPSRTTGSRTSPISSRVDVFVQGDELIADFSGTDAPGQGADQRHPRRHLVGHLQRALPHDRPVDSQEFRVLPPDQDRGPARHSRQCRLSGTRGRGQHGDPPEARTHRDRRAGPGRARARHGGGERHRRQLRLRRAPPRL